MSKAILISIRPQWVAKILNLEKLWEIRKMFPSDYVGWVYIYCTKGKPYLKHSQWLGCPKEDNVYYTEYTNELKTQTFNGKVVARFWCDKVEEIYFEKGKWGGAWAETLKHSCLTFEELENYLNGKGKAIHITKLEIFDRPKEISEFKKNGWNCEHCFNISTCCMSKLCAVKKPPQSWCYVEV